MDNREVEERKVKMTHAVPQSLMRRTPASSFIALICSLLIAPGDTMLLAQQAQNAATPEQQTPSKIPPEQLDSLVAPIALYPDPMLSQTLVASTYPLEVVQLQQWLTKNSGLKDQALADAVKKQGWDPSIQVMAALPQVVKQMAENIKWTADLGNAFLSQQDDVMGAVQRMRQKAKDTGNLKSSEQQKVETKVVESKSVIVIEQANPQVVYVPSYNPTVVYGPPVYAYPPIAYPPPGYYAAGMAISFGVGVAMGAFWGGGGWGYGCGWHGGGNAIVINNNNNFVSNYNRQNINRSGNRSNVGNSTWQHNPQHRGGAPYSDRATATKYGGTARGDSMATRQATARQNQSLGNRQQAGSMDRGAGSRDVSRGSGGPSAGDMGRGGGGGGDRIGNRQVSSSSGVSDRSAFSGASSGRSGNSARASSYRGSSSFGGSRGGGSFRGGGGRRR